MAIFEHLSERASSILCEKIIFGLISSLFEIWSESRIMSSLRPGTLSQSNFVTYLQPFKKALEAREIRKMMVNKSECCQLFVVSKKKKPSDRSYKPVR